MLRATYFGDQKNSWTINCPGSIFCLYLAAYFNRLPFAPASLSFFNPFVSFQPIRLFSGSERGLFTIIAFRKLLPEHRQINKQTHMSCNMWPCPSISFTDDSSAMTHRRFRSNHKNDAHKLCLWILKIILVPNRHHSLHITHAFTNGIDRMYAFTANWKAICSGKKVSKNFFVRMEWRQRMAVIYLMSIEGYRLQGLWSEGQLGSPIANENGNEIKWVQKSWMCFWKVHRMTSTGPVEKFIEWLQPIRRKKKVKVTWKIKFQLPCALERHSIYEYLLCGAGKWPCWTVMLMIMANFVIFYYMTLWNSPENKECQNKTIRYGECSIQFRANQGFHCPVRPFLPALVGFSVF